MALFRQPILTARGLALQAKVQADKTKLNTTRIGMGDGNLNGQAIGELSNLISEKVSLSISKKYIDNKTSVFVGGYFTNENLQIGFSWREIGLYALDPDEGEILYCYANAQGSPDYIPGVGAEVYEKYVYVRTEIANANSVSFDSSGSVIFVTEKEFLGHTGDMGRHTSLAEKARIEGELAGKADKDKTNFELTQKVNKTGDKITGELKVNSNLFVDGYLVLKNLAASLVYEQDTGRIVMLVNEGISVRNSANTGYAPIKCSELKVGTNPKIINSGSDAVQIHCSALDIRSLDSHERAAVLCNQLYLNDNISFTQGEFNKIISRSTGFESWNYDVTALMPILASNVSGPSSFRYKKNIKNIDEQTAQALLECRIVEFEYINKHMSGKQYGLIAEELLAIDPAYVYYNENSEVEGINYPMLIAPLLKLCQQQQTQINHILEMMSENHILTPEQANNIRTEVVI